MTPRNWRRLNVAMPWLVIIGLLIVWQAVVDFFGIAAFVLPAPTAVWAAFLEYRDAILHNAMFTLKNTMFGFALGIVVGVILGVLIGSFRLVYSGLYPLLIGVNSVPKAAVVPILVLWLGIGTAPAIATAFLLCFFPIAVNVATGLATVEPELEDVLRSLGASKLDILRKVGLPRSMPYFFASLKVAITLAFVGTVISETLASNDGIGYLMLQASSQFRVPLMFAGLAVIAIMGIATYVVFAVLEARLTSWATRRQDAPLGAADELLAMHGGRRRGADTARRERGSAMAARACASEKLVPRVGTECIRLRCC